MRRVFRTAFPSSVVLVALTVALGMLFKLAAFGREAFITSRFGLSSVTDVYFALQQFPLTAFAYIVGPFGRAFTPAYASAHYQEERVPWLSGLMLYTAAIGLAITALSFFFAPQILGAIAGAGGWSTLAILSVCYLPIVLIGLRAATWNSYGKNLRSLVLTGSPYVVMTVALIAMYLMGSMGNLSLATSMTIGWAVVGAFAGISVLSTEKPFRSTLNLFRPWKFDAFRKFTRQLTASSVETAGYSGNLFLLLYFMARTGTGAISANNCATRIGMLGYSLFALPLMQLLQSRLCRTPPEHKERLALRYVATLAVGAGLFAISLYIFRRQVVTLIYLRGNFSASALEEVLAILPAWLCYFVVLCLNMIISQYMFHMGKGYKFTRNMIAGYAGTNLLRFATGHAMGAPWIVWCGVIVEGGAFLANMATSVTRKVYAPVAISAVSGQEA